MTTSQMAEVTNALLCAASCLHARQRQDSLRELHKIDTREAVFDGLVN
jgi:hypothetical protein